MLWQLPLNLLRSLPLQFVKSVIVARSKCCSGEALTSPRDFPKLHFLASCFAPIFHVPKSSRCRSGLWNGCDCFVDECVAEFNHGGMLHMADATCNCFVRNSNLW